MSEYSIAKAIDIENLSKKARAQFELDLAAGEYLLTPKFDGCAVHIELNDGRVEQCISGSGKPVRSLDYALMELLRVFPTGRVVLDAEAWVPDMEFQEISGLFRRHTSDSRLQLKVFNGYASSWLCGTSRSSGYKTRLGLLSYVLQSSGCQRIATAQGTLAFNIPTSADTARYWQALGGFDGAVLHHIGAIYFQGRAKYESVKIKPLLSYDLEVTGVNAAVGEKTGRATCALVCRWKDGGVQEVATGLSHAEQASPEQFLGKIIEVRAMGLTADGKLREPRFCGVREDKITPDH
jgi:DNA ligase-1